MKASERDGLLRTLQARFEKHMVRHQGVRWADVQAKVAEDKTALRALHAMETTGSEPDVISERDGAYTFCDCAAESPAGRRSLCYDPEALESRKANKPANSALAMAAHMGIEVIDETQYHALQALGEFDRKTSSWLASPADIRSRGGALFGDRRFGRVFIYHNGAESYYAARGFRGILQVG